MEPLQFDSEDRPLVQDDQIRRINVDGSVSVLLEGSNSRHLQLIRQAISFSPMLQDYTKHLVRVSFSNLAKKGAQRIAVGDDGAFFIRLSANCESNLERKESILLGVEKSMWKSFR